MSNPQGQDLKALLAAYDAAQVPDSQKKKIVAADVRALGATGKDAAMFTAVGMLGALKKCPKCGQMVSLMSKCVKQPSTYHCDIVEH